MWSDNDIDNAFQRLNPPEPEPAPFPLDAWLRLETQLDKEEVARTVRRKLWRFVALEVLIVALVGLGWLLWKPAGWAASPAVAAAPATKRAAASAPALTASGTETRPDGKALAAPAKAVAPAVVSPVAKSAMPAATPATATAMTPTEHNSARAEHHRLAVAPKRTPQVRESAENRQAAHRQLAFAPAATTNRRALTKRAETRATSRLSDAGTSATANQAALIGENARRNATPTQDNGAIGRSAVTTATNGATDKAASSSLRAASTAALGNESTTSGQADNAVLTPVAVGLALTNDGPLPAPLAKGAEATPVAIAHQPRFFIGLLGAPDVSTVRFASVERPLLNLGLTLEYQLTNRLRISTGLLRGNKEYYARREDYDWTNYPRALTRDFDWVEGKCTVLDVPLNLRYDAVVRDNARWFGTAGLSSFFMHRENYSYDYQEGGEYKLWEMPGLVNANYHLFSVLNLSAGYERSLGQHWRLQAEPYAKLPLGGVGAGKVKLTSAGVFLGVKYGF